jgi:arylsulfatase A-like enzyme/Flp pilus assembly protein TadD
VLALALLAAQAATTPNVLLVTIDTLRADRVGAYGYAAGRTPVLDRLARDGVLVEDASVQVPETRPSHACLLTGRYPFEHGIRDNYSPPLKPGLPTLAGVLRERGYETAAFLGAYPVAAVSGLDRGFERYDAPFGPEAADASRVERPAAEVADAAIAFLKKPRTRPFFVWVHFFDPHYPYEPPAPFDREFAERPYDGEVAYADAQLGRLLAPLEGGRSGQTLVVVTSDHGEGLGDHGEDEHLLFVYESTLRVPLLIAWPGTLPAGARVRGQFRSVDLMPTILGLLGVPAPPTSGASRADALRQGSRLPDNESYVEALYGSLRFGYAPLRALRSEGWKYIDLPRPELYRVAEDPGESRNLVDERSAVATKMKERLRAYDPARDAPAAARTPVDPEAAERLAALGYVGGGPPPVGGKGLDPKDALAGFQAYRRDMFEAMRLYRRGDTERALPIFLRLSQGQTYSFNVQYFLGRSLLDQHRPREGAEALDRARELVPESGPVYTYLARAWSEAGQPDRALEALDRGSKALPRNADLLRERARLLLQRGDAAGARRAVDRALALRPRDALARALLSSCLLTTGELERAVTEAREATRLDPRATETWNALGIALGAVGREPEAATAFEKSLALEADQPDALFYLAAIDLRAGRAREALPRLEALERKVPSYPELAGVLAAARSLAAPPPPGAIRLRLIKVADRSEAAKIDARLATEDFAIVARATSRDASAPLGGDLGNVRPEDLVEPLRSAAFALEPGARSPVLETSTGFVILKRD